jgi:putative redox protein
MTSHDQNDGTPRPAPKPIVVTHLDGLRFAAQIRCHRLIVDQPERGGGHDEGPSPLELLGASLGTCVALYVHKFLAARGLPTDSLSVEVVQLSAPNPNRIAQFEVRIRLSDEIPMVYRPMLEAVARVCPAHNTLAHGAEVRVAIEFPERLPVEEFV